MALIKNYYKKGRKRANAKRANPSNLSKEVGRLKRAVAGEYKQKDFQINASSINWGGSNYIINDSNQGVAEGQHVAAHIKNSRLTLRGCFKGDGATISNVRLTIVQDKQNVLSVSDLWAVSANVGAPFSPKRETTRYESKILWDKVFTLDPGNQVKYFKINLPLNFHTSFSGATSTISTNALKLVVISDIDGTLSPPTMTCVGCVSYTDN